MTEIKRGYTGGQNTIRKTDCVIHWTVVGLRNRTGEERRRQTLCDKRDNNFVRKTFPPIFTFL